MRGRVHERASVAVEFAVVELAGVEEGDLLHVGCPVDLGVGDGGDDEAAEEGVGEEEEGAEGEGVGGVQGEVLEGGDFMALGRCAGG